jgi:putative oxidoreductase
MQGFTLLIARILLAQIYVVSGIQKMMSYGNTQGYMGSHGVSGALLPLVILTELGGGLMIVLGWRARFAAVLLAGFTLLTALFFHGDFADHTQLTQFMKNLAMAGGFLVLAVQGAGNLSLDRKRSHWGGGGLELR